MTLLPPQGVPSPPVARGAHPAVLRPPRWGARRDLATCSKVGNMKKVSGSPIGVFLAETGRKATAVTPRDAALNNICLEYSYDELFEATDGFSPDKKLGMGSYGTVYSGTLRSNADEVAVKHLANPKRGGFEQEVQVLSKFRHPNLVTLQGFARRGDERYLVYELMTGGDVRARIQNNTAFTWRYRLSVAIDAARGLSHLQSITLGRVGAQVFHRDVKSENILMDRNLTGKVCDFGIALVEQAEKVRIPDSTPGTKGYLDPNYIRSRNVTSKTDVYSFAMVLLEVLTGKPPVYINSQGVHIHSFGPILSQDGACRQRLEHYARDYADKWAQFPPIIAEKLVRLAVQCAEEEEDQRPSFTDIIVKLREWLRNELLYTLAHPKSCHAPGSANFLSTSEGSPSLRIAVGDLHVQESYNGESLGSRQGAPTPPCDGDQLDCSMAISDSSRSTASRGRPIDILHERLQSEVGDQSDASSEDGSDESGWCSDDTARVCSARRRNHFKQSARRFGHDRRGPSPMYHAQHESDYSTEERLLMYLPKVVGGRMVLVTDGDNRWRATNEYLQSETHGGVSYRKSKDMDDRVGDGPVDLLAWDEVRVGYDEDDAWVRFEDTCHSADSSVLGTVASFLGFSNNDASQQARLPSPPQDPSEIERALLDRNYSAEQAEYASGRSCTLKDAVDLLESDQASDGSDLFSQVGFGLHS